MPPKIAMASSPKLAEIWAIQAQMFKDSSATTGKVPSKDKLTEPRATDTAQPEINMAKMR